MPFLQTTPDRQARAGELAMRYSRPRQREFALSMCERHTYAVDYLEQAPILLVAVAEHAHKAAGTKHFRKPQTPPLNGVAYEDVLKEWRQLIEIGWKLPKVMAHYKIAPQFRALLPGACTSAAFWGVAMMSRQMEGAQLAQIMPRRVTHQQAWLQALRSWYRRHLERNRHPLGFDSTRPLLGLDHPLCFTRWAAVAFARKGPPYAVGVAEDLADFAIARGERFNTDWSLVRAVDECARWHHELAREQEGQFTHDTERADYGSMPDVFAASTGHQVVALRTRKDLWEEGRVMNHCVFEYWDDVREGVSRIFSVRRPSALPGQEPDRRICTFELRKKLPGIDGLTDPAAGFYWPTQSQGWRANLAEPRPPQPAEAAIAVQEFLEAYVPGWPKRRGDPNERIDLPTPMGQGL